MTNLEDRIQAIEDREAIRELTTRYCHAIAAADAATIVDLFCEDGAFITGDRESRGKDALQKFYGGLAKQPPIPFIQNHVIDELSSDTARARCSAEIRMTSLTGRPAGTASREATATIACLAEQATTLFSISSVKICFKMVILTLVLILMY